MHLHARFAPFRLAAATGAALVAAALAGCAPADSGGSSSTTSAAGASAAASASPSSTCSKDQLKTLAARHAHDRHRQARLRAVVLRRRPDNGKGYESAVAYAIAEQLGLRQGRGHLGPRRSTR